MARKRSGFDRSTRRIYDTYMGAGYTQSETAERMGISRSTLYRWRRGESRVRETTSLEVRTQVEYLDEDVNISVRDLTVLRKTGSHQRTRDAAGEILDRLEREGRKDDFDLMVERPWISRRIGGREVRWRLGRGKDEESRNAWIRKMRERGYTGDLGAIYDEATGYTSM